MQETGKKFILRLLQIELKTNACESHMDIGLQERCLKLNYEF